MSEPERGERVVAPQVLDSGWFRRVLGHYPTGVSVVTALSADGAAVGLAVGSFTSVSLEPPLVAFLPARASSSWPRIEAAGCFCVNILAADQEPECRAFASRGIDKFAGLGWRSAGSGAPILDGVVAWIDCALEAVHDAGDHLIVVGRVNELQVERAALPLLFFQGGYGKFHAHSLAVRDERFGAQLQLLDRVRALMEVLAAQVGTQVLAGYCDGNEVVLLASAGSPGEQQLAAAIGQRLPALAPIGIWSMAWAEPAEIEVWLREVPSEARRSDYREALARIRERGYCFGLETADTEIGTLISSRAVPHAETTPEERRLVASLERDPWGYVPPAPGSGVRPDVGSIWAPVFSSEGKIVLGLALMGLPRDAPPQTHALALLSLAEEVSRFAQS